MTNWIGVKRRAAPKLESTSIHHISASSSVYDVLKPVQVLAGAEHGE